MEDYEALKAEIQALRIELGAENFTKKDEKHDQCPIGNSFQGRPIK